MNFFSRSAIAALALTVMSLPLVAQEKPGDSDIPASFKMPETDYNYTKRVEMIPMHDGVKLYTVIVIPKGDQARADSADPHSLQRRRPRFAE